MSWWNWGWGAPLLPVGLPLAVAAWCVIRVLLAESGRWPYPEEDPEDYPW